MDSDSDKDIALETYTAPEGSGGYSAATAGPSTDASGHAIQETSLPVVPKPQPWNTGPPPPDGGLQAWIQVLAAFVLFFNTWGLLNCFGEFETYYLSGKVFTASSSNIAWIGSIQAFLLLFVGAFTGPIFDAGHLRVLLVVGTFLIVFGHMMLSLVHTYWEALLAQAFLIGIGAGCLFVPSIAIISTYFSTKLSTAIGLAASGSSLGGIIYPIVLHKLIPQIGFAWTVRTIGFMALALLCIPCAFMRMRVMPPQKRKLVDLSAFKELPLTLFIIGGLIGFAGLLIPFYYISYYAEVTGATDDNLAFYLLPILNAASIFGRILPNILADKAGPLNVFVPAAAITGVLVFCLVPAKTAGGVVAIAVLYGFFSGTFVSMPPSIIVSLTPPNKRGMLGTRIGMSFCIIGLGLLVGAPVAGVVLGSQEGNLHFTDTWVFGGTLLLAATAVFAVVRVAHKGTKVMVKC